MLLDLNILDVIILRLKGLTDYAIIGEDENDHIDVVFFNDDDYNKAVKLLCRTRS